MTETLLAETVDNTPAEQPTSYRDALLTRFKDDEAIAKGKWEADNLLKVYERQMDEYRKDILEYKQQNDSKARLEDLIDQFEKSRLPTNNTQPTVNVENTRPEIDLKQIESLFATKLAESEASKRQEENFNMVKGKLKERYGDNSNTVLKQQIETLGISKERLDEMARKEPQLLIKALGLDVAPQQQNFQAPPSSSLRSDSFQPTAGSKRTWSYYQRMKKENPELYRNPKTNIDMHNDMLALGEAFQDGDYNSIRKF